MLQCSPIFEEFGSDSAGKALGLELKRNLGVQGPLLIDLGPYLGHLMQNQGPQSHLATTSYQLHLNHCPK